ncbi:MAG: hypothetical protein ACOCQD_04645 [archaeon]
MADDRGQRHKECEFPFCKEKGRILASMGDIEIAYCPKHRKKYGERIITALINSLFNYRLSKFMEKVKVDIFFDDNLLCENCRKNIKNYIIEKSQELDKIIEWGEENEVGIKDDSEYTKE